MPRRGPNARHYRSGKLARAKISGGHAYRLSPRPDVFSRIGLDKRVRRIDWAAVLGRGQAISVETTFHHDLPDLAACQDALLPLIERLAGRIERHGQPPLDKLFIKVRFSDFTLTSLECPSATPSSALFQRLLEQAWSRAAQPVRLLGVGVRLVSADARRQLSLFESDA